jgi:predicted nucleotidyltransferase
MDASAVAAELGADERTIRRAVERGAIRARRPSPRRLTIDNHELRYLRARWRMLQQLQRALRTEPNVAAGILFGSVARGDDGPASDIDLLVELKRDTFADASRLEERLTEALGATVQVTRVSDAERAPGVLLEVLEDGRPLVDRSGTWRRLQRRRNSLRRAAAHREDQISKRLAETFGVEAVDGP